MPMMFQTSRQRQFYHFGAQPRVSESSWAGWAPQPALRAGSSLGSLGTLGSSGSLGAVEGGANECVCATENGSTAARRDPFAGKPGWFAPVAAVAGLGVLAFLFTR